MDLDIAVIGGGASGMVAALMAGRSNQNLHRIAVLERMSRVGKKLMATGNGRCNITNIYAGFGDYHGGVSIMTHAMNRFSPDEVIIFFDSIGVACNVESGGKAYPASDQASSVVDVLRLALSEAGIEEICDFEVRRLERTPGGFRLTTADGRSLYAKRVILSTGGLTAPNLGGSNTGYKLLEGLGHHISRLMPALVQLKTEDAPIRPLKGIKYTGEIALLVDGKTVRSENGEVLFTEYGLSGPPVLQLSRMAGDALYAHKRVEARLSILPQTFPQAAAMLQSRLERHQERPLENFLTGLVNKRLGQTLIKLCAGETTGILQLPSRVLTEPQLKRLAQYLVDWRLPVTGTLGFDQAQVTAGGLLTSEINPETMESNYVRGLYITGEVLDIDGDCGGFNLQWAWASGMTAGAACAKTL